MGLTQRQLAAYNRKEMTPRCISNLFDKYARVKHKNVIDEFIIPIVEFFQIEPTKTRRGASFQIFRTTDNNGCEHSYYSALKNRLDSCRGIYIFHDSRGRAIYAGKAQRQTLWVEMNKAFNRDRKEVQSIKRVQYPRRRVKYNSVEERRRQIKKYSIALHDIAAYCSAYDVKEDALIGKLEALLVRTFANDLLNVRMEQFIIR